MGSVPWSSYCIIGLLSVLLFFAYGIVVHASEEPLDEEGMYDDSVQQVAWADSITNVPSFVILAFSCFFFSLVFNQRSLVYKPIIPGKPRVGTGYEADPRSFGLKHKDVFIDSADGTQLHAWFLFRGRDAESHPMPAILFLHSNAGDISQRLSFFKGLCSHLGAAVLALEYRGYGRSDDGNGWCEAAFIHDAAAAYEWLTELASLNGSPIDPARLYIFGRSIGGAVTMRLIAHLLGADPDAASPATTMCRKPLDLPLPAGIILENTFSSFVDVAKNILPPLRLLPQCILVRPIVRDEWRSAEWLSWIGRQLIAQHRKACQIKICLLSGAADVVVSPACMDKLRRAAEHSGAWERIVFERFPNSGHMDTWVTGGSAYWKSLQTFLA